MQDLKKNIFWIIAPLITVMSLFIFFRATGKLNKERENNLNTINGSYSSLQAIRSNNPLHPNEFSQAGMVALIDDLKDDLREAWARQYARQEKVFIWSPTLGNEVIDSFSSKMPIEFLVPYPGQSPDEQTQLQERMGQRVEEAPQRDREIYKLYVSQLLPELAKKIDAEWTAQAAAGGDGDDGLGGGGAAGGAGAATAEGGNDTSKTEDDSLVIWSPANQTQLLQRFGWANRTPSTAEVMYAQEDIWVLNQWMEVIAETNRGADARYNAAVTEIVSIELPQPGQGLSLAGRIRLPGGGRSGESGGGNTEGMGEGGMMDAMGGMAGAEGGAPVDMAAGMETSDGNDSDEVASGDAVAVASNDPIDLRYVDRQYQPLAAAKLRNALNPNNKQPEDAYLAVAKRYPTRIRIKMDLRRLPDLLAACGNAPLTIEVRQVGINSTAQRGGGGGGGGGMMGGMMGGGGGGGGGMGMMGGGGEGGGGEGGGGTGGMEGMMGGGGGMAGMAGLQQAIDEFPYHEEVELYAIVYIFNPPDTSKLGKPKVDAVQGAADGNVPAAGAE